MELPGIGENCTVGTCNQLDFLPVKCDACQKVFCNNHYSYAHHNCPEAFRHNNQVPVCPLCNAPVPLKPGESPDAVVGQHIDNDCQSEKAQSRRKVYSNRCALKGCKQKELIPFNCQKCRKNYCIKHRHEMDHQCRGFENTGRAISSSGAAAVARTEKKAQEPAKSLQKTTGVDLNRERSRLVSPGGIGTVNGMSEEEAMRQAIALSLQDSHATQPTTRDTTDERQRQELDDEALARALQESEREAQARGINRQPSSDKKSCVLS